MSIKVPNSGKRKALIVIDVQPAFVNTKSRRLINNILKLVKSVDYDLVVEAVFYAEKGSLWDRLQDSTHPLSDSTKTVPEIHRALAHFHPVQILKSSRSVFKGKPDLRKYLRDNNIREIHLAGTETNDCIMASAFDAFDNGWPVYVIEECCDSKIDQRHDEGVQILRYQNLTNNSCLADTIEI